ncbi:MAG: hypothetical protein C0502_01200 [Opitutus sp.]|nr:hypothetical protein [Opitutus sp.]
MAGSPRRFPRPFAGFTLVEIMVVVAIIGLLCAIALPGFRILTQHTKASAFQNDFRAITGVFMTYNLQNGRWPAEVSVGEVPAELADALPKTYDRATPIGGFYDFNNNVSADGIAAKASIVIVTSPSAPMTDDLDLLELIDRMMDDGDLATGSIRLGSTNSLVIILEP